MTGAQPAGARFVSEAALQIALAAREPSTKSNLRRIVCKGDSITYGNEDSTGVTYPNLLAQALGSGVTVINNGQGGYTSTEVAITDGAVDPTLNAFTIPAATTATTVTLATPTGDFRTAPLGVVFSWTGTLTTGGTAVPGTLVHHVSSTDFWTFAATTAPGSPITVTAGAAFHCTTNDDKLGNFAIIDVGRNNPSNPTGVLADVAAMVARLSTTMKRYLVLGVTTGTAETTGTAGNTQVLALNAALSAQYGLQYVDVRTYMMTSGLAFSDLTPAANDTADIAAGTIPRQLLWSDGFHPNQYGYRALAKAVLDRLVALGWTADAPGPIPKTYPPNIALDGGFESGYLTGNTVTTNLAGNGSFAISGNAARSGIYGGRASITATLASVSVVFTEILPTSEAASKHADSVWIRPTKAVTATPTNSYYNGSFSYLTGTTGTGQACPAGVWTKVTLVDTVTPSGAVTLQASLAITGSFVAGDFLDFDDLAIAAGTTVP